MIGGRRDGARGQTLTEFALILPVLLLALMGVLDFGRAVFAYNAISNAAREGGRTAIVNQTPAEIRARAIAQATSLGIDPSSSSCPPAGTSGVCIEYKDATLSGPCTGVSNLGCVAEITVKLHRGSLMRKINARSVAELARMAQILGIAPPKS